MFIDYNKALENLLRADADKAVSTLLSGDIGTIISIFPQALNPVLKAMESLGKWESILIIPYHFNKNKPIYILVKIDPNQILDEVQFREEVCQ